MTLWARFVAWAGKWLAIGGAVLAALAASGAWAFKRGFERAEDKADAKDAETAAAGAQVVVDAASTRRKVDDETAKLPDAGTQRVLDADRDSAAGQLRDWMRGAGKAAADPGKPGEAD